MASGKILGTQFLGWSIAGAGLMVCVAAIKNQKPWEVFTGVVTGTRTPGKGATNTTGTPVDHGHPVTGVPQQSQGGTGTRGEQVT